MNSRSGGRRTDEVFLRHLRLLHVNLRRFAAATERVYFDWTDSDGIKFDFDLDGDVDAAKQHLGNAATGKPILARLHHNL